MAAGNARSTCLASPALRESREPSYSKKNIEIAIRKG